MYIYAKNQSSKEARAYFDYTYITNHSETYYYTVYLLCNKKLYLHPELNFPLEKGLQLKVALADGSSQFSSFLKFSKTERIRIHVGLMASYGRVLSRSKKALEALKDIGFLILI